MRVRLFEGVCVERYDDRHDYGEDRWISYGLLDGEVVVCAWVDKGDTVRVISLRKATKGEEESYFKHIGDS